MPVVEAADDCVPDDPLTIAFELPVPLVVVGVSDLFCIFIFPLIRSVDAAFICFKFVLLVVVDIVVELMYVCLSVDGGVRQS